MLQLTHHPPWAALAAGVLAVAAYLSLVNLDYAALWHDEAPAALIGRNLLQRGDISGWDGRNLVGPKIFADVIDVIDERPVAAHAVSLHPAFRNGRLSLFRG